MTGANLQPHSRPLAFAVFHNEKIVQPSGTFSRPWPDVVKLLSSRAIRPEKSGPMLGGYALTGQRNNTNISHRSLIQLDIDSEVERDDETRQILRVTRHAPALAEIEAHIGPFEWVASSSHSHDPGIGLNKYRVTMLPDRDIQPEEHRPVLEALDALLNGCLDRKAWPLSQAFYLPSCPAETDAFAFSIHNRGQALNVDDVVANGRAIMNVRPALARQVASQGSTGEFSLPDLEAALRYIDPDKGGRGPWWSKLAAISDAFGEDGRPIAEAWSRGSLWSQASTEFTEQVFNKEFSDSLSRASYTGIRSTIASVFAEAVAAGWSGPQELPDWLDEMNRHFCWVIRQKAIYRLQERDFITTSELRDQFANRMTQVLAANKTRTVSIAEAWIKDPRRRDHQDLILAPGGPAIVDGNALNTWRGFKTTPSPGDVKPFLDLLRRLVPDREVAGYLVQWMAHLVQRPHVKMHVAPVVWSAAKGVGKNLLFECLLAAIGSDHSILIEKADLARDFNAWAKDKIFVIGDEVIGSDPRLDADKLKGLVTSATIHINQKHQPVVEQRNFANFVFLSNHSNALFIDEHERRYLVWEIEAGPLSVQEFEQFTKWRDSGGIAAMFDMLLTLPLTGFNAKAPAPRTKARSQMIAANKSDLELWAETITASPAQQVIGREIATAQELALRYTSECGHRTSAKAVNNAFKRLGAYQFVGQVRLPDNRKARALAIDRPEFWKAQGGAAWAAELAKVSRL